jgi:hypothetical protein
MPDVDAVFVHSLYEPKPIPKGSPEQGFGLIDAARATPPRIKPAYCALQRLAARAGTPARCAGG